MATAQKITILNYDTLLVESTQGRAGTPDGNIFFDTANDLIEIITAEELANVDLGSGAEANPLTDYFGITIQALYAFERRQRRVNTALRNFKHGLEVPFRLAGAFGLVNGIKFAAGDELKIRGSGFTCYAETLDGETDVDRIYFCPRSLNPIDSASQPYYMLPASTSESDRQSAVPTDFDRLGPIDEVVQVYGDTTFGDTAGDFDYTERPLVVAVRPFGRSFGETTSISADLSELGGFSAGLGVGDDINDENIYDYEDIITTPIAPFDGMSYESFGSPQTKTGFTDGTADFSVVINNTGGGTIAQVAAYLDAIMTLDTDNDSGVGSYIPKRGSPLYSRDATGRLVTKQGIYIDNISTAQQQLIVQTDDSGDTHTYPFFPTVRISVSDAWVNDANAWAQVMYLDGSGSSDFNTANAVTVNDSSDTPAAFTSADALGSSGSYYIEFPYAYDTNTQAGLTAGTDKDIVVLAEGDGGAQPERGTGTITRTTLITISALSSVETNLG